MNKLLLLLSTALSVLMLEHGLRQFGPVSHDIAQRTFLPSVGPWRAPNTFVPRPRYSNENHRGHYTNSLGMVGPEIARKDAIIPGDSGRTTRILFLGDSIIEGLAVPNGQRVTDLIDERSAGSLEAINMATSGIGTVQQLALYRTVAPLVNADVVVLALFPGNDIANNYLTLEQSFGNHFLDRWAWADVQNDSLVVHEPAIGPSVNTSSHTTGVIRGLLPSTYAHLSLVKNRLAHVARRSGVQRSALSEGNLSYLDVYSPPTGKTPWSQAWAISEMTLLQLRNEVASNGSIFQLVILPDPIHAHAIAGSQQLRNQILNLESGPGNSSIGINTFDPFYPHKRIRSFADANGIETISLFRSFVHFQNDHQLQPPYFGFTTDGHWSVLGHAVAADSLLPALLSIAKD